MVCCPQHRGMGHGGAPRDTPVWYGLRYLGVGHPYFERERCSGLVVLCRLKRTLSSCTRRLISAVRPAFSHTRCTNLVVSLHTWPAASVPKGTPPTRFVIRPMESAFVSETDYTLQRYMTSSWHGCYSSWKRCSRHLPKAFPSSIAAPPVSWGLSRLFSAPLPPPPPPPYFILHLGAHQILHDIWIGAQPLHRHTQYGSKANYCITRTPASRISALLFNLKRDNTSKLVFPFPFLFFRVYT